MNDFPVTAARATLAAAEARMEAAHEARAAADREICDARDAVQLAQQELLKAEALEAVDSIPVGTKVRHHAFADIFAVVIPGTQGIAVKHMSGVETDGYARGEWIPVDAEVIA